jgi:hypothetical protein
MSNKSKYRNINNHIGEHCQTLVDDFFNFVDGNIQEVRIITELRDISEPMPPQLEQIRKMLARCNKVWKDYCGFMMLPRESNVLFINRVKKKWLTLEKQQSQIPMRKRKDKDTSN